MYLYIQEDGKLDTLDSEPTQEDLENVDDGYLYIIRFSSGRFEIAEVDSEELPDDEDDEDSDTHTEYTISNWSPI